MTVLLYVSLYTATRQGKRVSAARLSLHGLDVTRLTVDGLCMSDIGRAGLMRSTVGNVLSGLSPRSSCAGTRRAGGLRRPLRKGFRNVNMRFGVLRSALMIVRPAIGKPSRGINVVTNSHVIDMGSATVTNMGVDHSRVIHELQKPQGSGIHLNVVHRNVGRPLRFAIAHSGVPITAMSTTCVIAPDMKLIHLSDFKDAARRRVAGSVGGLRSLNVGSLVLSLRRGNNNCLRTTARVTDRFLARGSLVICAGKLHIPCRRRHTGKGKLFHSKGVVILMSRFSTSTTRVMDNTVRSRSHKLIIKEEAFNGKLMRGPFILPSNSVVHLAISHCCAPDNQYVRGPCAGKSGRGCGESILRQFGRKRLVGTSDVRFPSSLGCRALHGKHAMCNNKNIVPSCFVPLSAAHCASCRQRLSTGNTVMGARLGCVSGGHGGLMGGCPSFRLCGRSFRVPRRVVSLLISRKRGGSIGPGSRARGRRDVPRVGLRLGTLVTHSL